jgi:hypothetical protein
MKLGEYEVEQRRFSILTVPARGVCADVGHLHHASQVAIYEERRLHDERDLSGPPRASLVEEAHQFREPPGHGLVVVLHQKPVLLWALTLKKSVKPSHNLSESLFKGWGHGRRAPETPLIRALGKQAAVVPLTNGFSNLPEKFTPLRKRQMNIRGRLSEILAIFLHAGRPLQRGLPHEGLISRSLNGCSPFSCPSMSKFGILSCSKYRRLSQPL